MVETDTLVEVKNLKTYFYLDEGVLKAVDDVSFDIGKKQILGLIGESGCGKSVTAQSVIRIVPKPGKIAGGNINFNRDGEIIDVAALDVNGSAIRSIRGREISMIFQEPMTSLSPVHTIGNQIMEVVLLHRTREEKEARELTIEMLAKVGIPNPERRIDYYPHQLSGGLRQRAMIAMALVCNPSLLIADEPTTALDVTVQAQILDLIRALQDQLGMAVLYITHDLGVIAELAAEVAVMYLGRIVERADTKQLFRNPMHPYTRALLRSIPRRGKEAKTRLEVIKGTVPVPLGMPRECGFCSRCTEAMPGICDKKIPALVESDSGHSVRCFLHNQDEVSYDE